MGKFIITEEEKQYIKSLYEQQTGTTSNGQWGNDCVTNKKILIDYLTKIGFQLVNDFYYKKFKDYGDLYISFGEGQYTDGNTYVSIKPIDDNTLNKLKTIFYSEDNDYKNGYLQIEPDQSNSNRRYCKFGLGGGDKTFENSFVKKQIDSIINKLLKPI